MLVCEEPNRIQSVVGDIPVQEKSGSSKIKINGRRRGRERKKLDEGNLPEE
jgi:hypothetical protein